nr:xylulose kinase-1 [Tanacetum cinerariifolium]
MAREDTNQSSTPPIASPKASLMVSSIKLPILKKDEAGNEVEVPPIIAQQILARTREIKAKSTLLIAIPGEHLARFYGIKDAKTIWDAIKTRFGGNAESKKMQKNNSQDSKNKGRDVGNAGYIGRNNGKRLAKEKDEKALCEKLRKANLEIIDYQYGLESIEGQLYVHQQNEVICKEKIIILEYNVKDKSNLLKYTQKQLDEALREKEDLKAKLEKFETSSKNLTKLLNSQICVKVKTGLGYDTQFNEKEVIDEKEEVTKTMFDNHSSDEENSLANDRFKKGEGFHAVPPPLIGNYMPPKHDLSFAGVDKSICMFKISETITSLSKDVKDAPETSTAFVEKPKEVRTSAPLIDE